MVVQMKRAQDAALLLEESYLEQGLHIFVRAVSAKILSLNISACNEKSWAHPTISPQFD
jgi:hypothetical protein